MDTQEYLRKHFVLASEGLSEKDVAARVERRLDNRYTGAASKSTGEIIRSHAFTFFNILNFCLLILVLMTGSIKNSLFFWIVLVNMAIGAYQEIKARRTIEKLSLLSRSKALLIRGGREVSVEREEIVQDDICVLKKGAQIPVDAILVSDDTLEVDESMLTGESMHIVKKQGDFVYGGSIVLAGHARAQACRVGGDTYVNQLSTEARAFNAQKSKLERQIGQIIKVVSFLLVPTGILLFVSQFLFVKDLSWQDALLNAVTGIIGMVPEGLVLLTSVALAVGVVNLARDRVLTKELSAIETLARVDVLCLDKTGTLTEGTLGVSDVTYYGPDTADIAMAFASVAARDEEQNATAQAIGGYFKEQDGFSWIPTRQIPFSSENKWQAVAFEGKGVFVLGAPDIVLPPDARNAFADARAGMEQGKRVVALVHCDSLAGDALPDDREALALICMEDKIRDDAPEILRYFKEQQVEVRVISGDHPQTLQHICTKVGIHGKCIDGAHLPPDIERMREVVRDTMIFGRVRPEQKKMIVQALQDNGHVVAMTGDGVNDILALKQSDCGIAMASGSDATQSVAQFVLLDSAFSALPKVVNQGRRVINNVNRAAGLFLMKTTYSFLISLTCSLAMLPYPFQPIQMALLNLLAIGFPSFMLALEPNYELVKGSFMKKALMNAVPSGVATALIVFFSINFSAKFLSEALTHQNQVATAAIAVAMCIHLWTLFQISLPLTKWRLIIFGIVIAACFIILFIEPVLSFYGIVFLEANLIIYTVVLCLAAVELASLFRRLLAKGSEGSVKLRRRWAKRRKAPTA